MAHHGVLFLDELAEFPRHVLESALPAVARGEVNVTRARQTAVFPAKALLVAACNPCPCGYFGITEGRRGCECSPTARQRYYERMAPAKGAFDIQVRLPVQSALTLGQSQPGEDSATVRARIVAARGILDQWLDPASTALERVARTIAALAGSYAVLPEHRAEAATLTDILLAE